MVNLKALVAGAAGLVGNLLPPRGEAGRLRRALKAKDLNETYRAELSAELAVVLFACAPGENVTAKAFAEGGSTRSSPWPATRVLGRVSRRALHLGGGGGGEPAPSSRVLDRDADRVRGLTEHARAMLTGRLLRNASDADPDDADAAAAADATAHYVELDAFKGSTTNELIDLAKCRPYVGTTMDGRVCPAGRKKKKKKEIKPVVNYNDKKIGPGVVKRD
ncbi:ATPase [Aureococcus anophagefferens]|nr:ATPase [Aureococcus anophagefferens]